MPGFRLLEHLNDKLFQWVVCKLNKDLVLLQNYEGVKRVSYVGYGRVSLRCLNEVLDTDVGWRRVGCASSLLQCWWMCHRRMKRSSPSSHPSPVWFSPRSLRPPAWSTKIDRGLSWCVSTWQPPVSINGPAHTCHDLLTQNCLYFLTQVLS